MCQACKLGEATQRALFCWAFREAPGYSNHTARLVRQGFARGPSLRSCLLSTGHRGSGMFYFSTTCAARPQSTRLVRLAPNVLRTNTRMVQSRCDQVWQGLCDPQTLE